MQTFSRFFCLLVFLSFASANLHAQVDNKAIFRDLTRLDGVWFQPGDRGDRLEIWKYENDSTMTGRGVRIKAETGDTVLLETLRLELRDTNITYYAKVRGQNEGKSIPFVMTEANINEYIFENPAQDDPKKIRYVLLDRRELQVTTEGVRNGRPVKQEYFFEREFNPATTEFRIRGGLNTYTLFQLNEIGTTPKFSARPGWELGFTAAFKGSGGFLSVNFDMGLSGKFSHAVSEFDAYVEPDSTYPTGQVHYVRDLTYNQTWISLGILPEVKLRRNGSTSLIFGPTFSYLLINSVRGTEEPLRNKKVYNFNNDFKKKDIGAVLGLNFDRNIGKVDLGGQLGIRAQFGLSNVDNLYIRCSDNGGGCFYNGRLGLAGISVLYSVNLLKI